MNNSLYLLYVDLSSAWFVACIDMHGLAIFHYHSSEEFVISYARHW